MFDQEKEPIIHIPPHSTAPLYCSADFIHIVCESEPVDEVVRQGLRLESPCVPVMRGGHGQSVLAGREVGLDGAAGRNEGRSSEPIDLQSVHKVWRHELVDGVQLAQLPIRRDDHWLHRGVALRAAWQTHINSSEVNAPTFKSINHHRKNCAI